MLRRVILIFYFFSLVTAISAQIADSIHSLGAIEINADRISVFSVGTKVEKLDSTLLSVRIGANLASLLSEQSPVSLRSYGPGGIATLSLRGTNSSQSGVFWNGINLQQSNIGMTDLSRISTFDFSDISLQSGGASALLGSGVIGGSLQLSNALKFATPVKSALLIGISNFGNANTGLKVAAGNDKFAYSGSISGDWDKNNFIYKNYTGEQVHLDHALVKSLSTIHQMEYILTSKQRLKAGVWYQATDRQIPASLTMTSNDQQQWDNAFRSTLQWTYTDANQSLAIRSAFIKETEHFVSESASIDAFYHLNTYQLDFEYKRALGKNFLLWAGTTGHVIKADVTYYNGIKYQPEGSLWLSLVYSDVNKRITSAINLRKDFSRGYLVPFCPSLSTVILISSHISASINVSKNFRVPTMNDKYWVPGGNPDLKSESSWNLESGFEFKLHASEYVKSKINLNVYNLMIDNMIQWLPLSSAVWSPSNVQKVWSRGVELSSLSEWNFAGFDGYFRFGYVYSPSTYKESSANQTEILNKQLIYIPLHKVQETFYISRGVYYTLFSITLTGKRFVQSDNSASLPAYTLFDFYTGTTFKTKRINFRLQAAVRNILNAEYQSVLYYPEPGRSFMLSLLVSK